MIVVLTDAGARPHVDLRAAGHMILTGRVVRKYVADGEHCADLEIVIATQAGPVSPCSATLALPTRA